eukprot:6200017-Pleurochrysis_carterae.AAC.1
MGTTGSTPLIDYGFVRLLLAGAIVDLSTIGLATLVAFALIGRRTVCGSRVLLRRGTQRYVLSSSRVRKPSICSLLTISSLDLTITPENSSQIFGKVFFEQLFEATF